IGESILLCDLTFLDQAIQVPVEGFGATFLAGLENGGDLLELPLFNHFPTERIHYKNFYDRHSSVSLKSGNKALGNCCTQCSRNLSPHCNLLVRREELEQTLHSLLCISAVKRAKNQVPCLCRRD